jgi:DNA-binding GntR family transcriptional regulator
MRRAGIGEKSVKRMEAASGAASRRRPPATKAVKPPPARKSAEQSAAPSASERFSRTGWLAAILRQRVLDGTYKPGERIREIQLRSEFGFSNGPIREALQAIVAEGLAERAPYHGVRVKALDEREIIELFQVRLALLEYAAELAARRRNAQAVAAGAALKSKLSKAFAKITQSGAHPSFNGELSKWLLGATGNAALRELWNKNMLQTLIYVNVSLKQDHGRKNHRLIAGLIDAVCRGQVSAARKAARALTEQTVVDLGIKGVF